MCARWDEDRLGYAGIGEVFTKLIGTIDESKVISIEAGYSVIWHVRGPLM